jgi:hypothetical protein
LRYPVAHTPERRAEPSLAVEYSMGRARHLASFSGWVKSNATLGFQ